MCLDLTCYLTHVAHHYRIYTAAQLNSSALAWWDPSTSGGVEAFRWRGQGGAWWWGEANAALSACVYFLITLLVSSAGPEDPYTRPMRYLRGKKAVGRASAPGLPDPPGTRP